MNHNLSLVQYAKLHGVSWTLRNRVAETIPQAYRLTLVSYRQYLRDCEIERFQMDLDIAEKMGYQLTD